HCRAVKQHLDVLDCQGADYSCREKGNQQVPHERQFDRVARQGTSEQVQEPGTEYPHDGQNGTKLDHNFEDFVIARGEVYPGPDQKQMCRAGDRDEFREPFDQTQKQGLQQKYGGFSHSLSYPAVSSNCCARRSISTVAMRRPAIFSTVNLNSWPPCCSSQRSPSWGR